MSLTYFHPKLRGNMEKKTTQSTSDLSPKHQTSEFIWEHHIWCHVKISEVATLVSMFRNFWCSLEVAEPNLCFVIRVMCGGNALFFRWLLSLCYIIKIWSCSSHLHQMLLCGPLEKVLISRFPERKKNRKRDCSV